MKRSMRENAIYLAICIILSASVAIPSVLSAREYALDDLYAEALQKSEKVRLSEENVQIAEAGKGKAMASLLPRLTTFAGVTAFTESKYSETRQLTAGGTTIPFPGTLIQPNTATTWGVRLDETLSLGGREFTSLKISRENVEKNRFDSHAIKEEYMFIVASAYYNVLKAEKNLEIAEANVLRLTAHRMAAEKRLRIGEVTKAVLLRAEAELSGAVSEQMTTKNNLELAMTQLKRIVGITGDVRLKRESPAAGDLNRTLEESSALALSGRSDLKGLEIQKKLAELQVRHARGAHWPNISLSGVYSGMDQAPAPTTINRESIYAGASLNFPIFEGGLRQAEIKEARSREKQSVLLFEDLKKSIETEVRAAHLDLITLKAILRYLEDQSAFARENYQVVSRQFEFGLVNSIDVTDANTLLVSSERKLADAGYNYQTAILRMKKATGVLLKEILAKN